jgi:hypothetical protein
MCMREGSVHLTDDVRRVEAQRLVSAEDEVHARDGVDRTCPLMRAHDAQSITWRRVSQNCVSATLNTTRRF